MEGARVHVQYNFGRISSVIMGRTCEEKEYLRFYHLLDTIIKKGRTYSEVRYLFMEVESIFKNIE